MPIAGKWDNPNYIYIYIPGTCCNPVNPPKPGDLGIQVLIKPSFFYCTKPSWRCTLFGTRAPMAPIRRSLLRGRCELWTACGWDKKSVSFTKRQVDLEKLLRGMLENEQAWILCWDFCGLNDAPTPGCQSQGWTSLKDVWFQWQGYAQNWSMLQT